MTMTEIGYRLAIRPHNCFSDAPCALCGECTDPRHFEIVDPEYAPVCPNCARQHAPELFAMLDRWYAHGDQKLGGDQ